LPTLKKSLALGNNTLQVQGDRKKQTAEMSDDAHAPDPLKYDEPVTKVTFLARAAVSAAVCGTGRLESSGDGGPPERAGMDRPHGCWLGASGRLYTSDSEHHRARVSTAD